MVLQSEMMSRPVNGYSHEDGEAYYYSQNSMQMARPEPYYSNPQPNSNNYKYFNSTPQPPQHHLTAPGAGCPTRPQHGSYENNKYFEGGSLKVKEKDQDGNCGGKKHSSDDMYYYAGGKEQCADDIQNYYGGKQHKYEDHGGAGKVQSSLDYIYHNDNGSTQLAESYKLIRSGGKFPKNGQMMFMDPNKYQIRRPTAGYFDDEKRPIESWELKSLD